MNQELAKDEISQMDLVNGTSFLEYREIAQPLECERMPGQMPTDILLKNIKLKNVQANEHRNFT